jgi:hypothetical protein
VKGVVAGAKSAKNVSASRRSSSSEKLHSVAVRLHQVAEKAKLTRWREDIEAAVLGVKIVFDSDRSDHQICVWPGDSKRGTVEGMLDDWGLKFKTRTITKKTALFVDADAVLKMLTAVKDEED